MRLPVPLHLSTWLLGCLLAAASLRAFADILRVILLVVLQVIGSWVFSARVGGGVVDVGDGGGVSTSSLLLLLSNTIAAASSHAGMHGIVVGDVICLDGWITGGAGAFVGVLSDGDKIK